jgi:DNA helicase-2/ATP-dependent DNA helicase PcrA
VGTYERLEWTFPLGHARISVTPDRVVVAGDGTVRVQQIRTGRKTKSEPDKEIYALLRAGANVQYPGHKVFIEAHYLSTGEVLEIPAKDENKKLQKYLTAIKSIESGDFHATPEAKTCPSCQFYFACEG